MAVDIDENIYSMAREFFQLKFVLTGAHRKKKKVEFLVLEAT